MGADAGGRAVGSLLNDICAMPNLDIRLADETFEDYLLNGQFAFMVHGYADARVGEPVAAWALETVEPFEKDYGLDCPQLCDRRQSTQATVLVAWLGEHAVGHIVLRAHWNGFGYIDELAVDRPARRLGVARSLLERARQWSQARELAGVVLETQNNNLAACRLYETFGFVVGSVDHLCYRGIDPQTRETGIFWYLIFTSD